MTHRRAHRVGVFTVLSGGALESVARRRGFTLVELLVVIGIIVVLVALVVMGVRHTSQLAARHETEVELKVCEDLLKEYQAVNGMKNLEGPASTVTPTYALNLPANWLNHSYKLPIYLDAIGVPEVTGTQPETAFGLEDLRGAPPTNNTGRLRSIDVGDMSEKDNGNNPRYGARAVYNTQGVMFLLLKDPRNRAVVSAIPSKRILETWAPFYPGDKAQAPFTVDAAVLLDGWENPIIYVPRGGIHVWMNIKGTGSDTPWDYKEYIVRSSGTYEKGKEPAVTRNDRPFFDSAGPDGYFADLNPDPGKRTDRSLDNVYSFQSQ